MRSGKYSHGETGVRKVTADSMATAIWFHGGSVLDAFRRGIVRHRSQSVMFTERHAATCAGMDGDGIQDLVTGKRYMSHFGYSDP